MTDISRFRRFVTRIGLAADACASGTGLPAGVEAALGELVASDDWLPDAFAVPGTDRYRQYLLHCDSAERFSIVSFVWAAGQETPIHDHTVWGAVGQLRGSEISTPYTRTANGALTRQRECASREGHVFAFTPEEGDIHSVANPGPGIAISIHIYGANIGRVTRSTFDPVSGDPSPFVSGYDNDVLPNIWQ